MSAKWMPIVLAIVTILSLIVLLISAIVSYPF